LTGWNGSPILLTMTIFSWKRKAATGLAAVPKVKMSTVEKAIFRVAQGYPALPVYEKRCALDLVRSVWTILGQSSLAGVSELLMPFVAAIAIPVVRHSRTLGSEIVLALDKYGGELRDDLALQIGGPHAWPGRVAAARADLERQGVTPHAA